MRPLLRLAGSVVVLLAVAVVASGGTNRFPSADPSAKCCLAALKAMETATELIAQRKLAEAAKYAAAAAELTPVSAAPHVLSGIILEQQDRPAEAADEFREALAWDPDESRALAALERLQAPRYADTATQFEVQLFHLINEARETEGVKPLKLHPVLSSVAREHSGNMRDLGFFAHESPCPGCRTSLDRYLRCFDCQPRLIGENVCRRWTRPEPALTEANIDDSHQDLMASPGHRRNILYPDFVYVGIGIATNAQGDYWITEMFTAPPPQTLPPKDRTP